MAIKTIIWDVGGVLERTEDPEPRRELAARLGTDVDSLSDLIFGRTDGYRTQLGKISRTEHEVNVARTLGIPPEEGGALFRTFFAGDRLDTDLVAAIRAIKPGYTTAVLSNYGDRLREKITGIWKIGDAFDHLVISAEVGVMKPDPKIYQIVLEATSSQPHEAVFIDDAPENIAAAQALGMHAIRFTSPQAAIQQLHALLAE